MAEVSIGTSMVCETSLDGGEAALLVTAALPFKMVWFLCQSWLPVEYL